MSMDYIRKTYNVPAKRGGRIRFQGRAGVIVGARDARLRARFDGIGTVALHPTWEIEYLPNAQADRPAKSGERGEL